MKWPKLQPVPESVTSQIEFRGLNRQYTASEREFADQLNISSEKYPVLAPRKRRYKARVRKAPSDPYQHVLDSVYADGAVWFVFNRTNTAQTPAVNETVLSCTGPGGNATGDLMVWNTPDGEYNPKIIYMNGYVCVFPDGKFYNVKTDTVIEGNSDDYFPSCVWKYSNSMGDNQDSLNSRYICANVPGLDSKYNDGDYVTLRFPAGGQIMQQVDPTTSYTARIAHVTNQYIVFDNTTLNFNIVDLFDLRISRKTPPFSFVCVDNNRLWGTIKNVLPAHPYNTFYVSENSADTTEVPPADDEEDSRPARYIKIRNPRLSDRALTLADIQDIYGTPMRVMDGTTTQAEIKPLYFGNANGDPYLCVSLPDGYTAGQAKKLVNGLTRAENPYSIVIDWEQTEIKYNDIRASELGCPYSWDCFEGTSMDSYAVEVGSEGDWTGIFPYKNSIYAFKEDVLHRVYGYYPSNYKLYDEQYKGIKRGCDRSVVIHNDVMYYYSTDGLVAYSGRKPVIVDKQLNDVFTSIVCSSDKDRLLLCTEQGLFVYDSWRSMWQKHNNQQYAFAHSVNGDTVLMYQDADDYIWMEAEVKNALTALGFPEEGTGQSIISREDALDWMAQTARILLYGGEGVKNSAYNYIQKYVDKLYVKADIPLGARLDVYISYDDGDFEPIATQGGHQIGLRVIPIIPRRCDQFALRFNGHGEAKVISVTKSISAGSEVVHHAV